MKDEWQKVSQTVSEDTWIKSGQIENEDGKEDEKRAGRSGTINQSISRRPIYSNFTPECPASVPQHRHRQSINQVGAGGGFTIWFTKLIPHFYTPSKLGGFRPASQHLWESYQSSDVVGGDCRLCRKLVFGRANQIEGPQSHHFGSPFIIICAGNPTTKVLIWYYWLLRISGFVLIQNYIERLWKKTWKEQETVALCCYGEKSALLWGIGQIGPS